MAQNVTARWLSTDRRARKLAKQQKRAARRRAKAETQPKDTAR